MHHYNTPQIGALQEAALMPLSEDDIEDVVLRSPKFLKELRAAHAEYRRKGGIRLEEARKQLGL